ncbi:MAG: DNA-binding protein WhiA [Clostridiales bacterium]|nr:DNA-binding protein WhiA [Clostridiales bacterium]
MNFTLDVKKEIVNHGIADNRVALSAYIRASATMGISNGNPTFFIVSETENVAEFFTSAFFELFGAELVITHAEQDRLSGRDKLVFVCPAELSENVLKELHLLKRTGGIRDNISQSLLTTETKQIAYIQGAFLGGGSCILPSETGKSGYHLEIVFSERNTARDFCDLLAQFELIARLTPRKDSYVVYIKSKEQIADFLAVIGAKNSLKKLYAVIEKRDKANNDNRTQNCMSGNADKVAIAAVKQVVAIQKLIDNGDFEELSPELKTLAKMRLERPTDTLQELARRLCVTKSCLNHRMRKLMELAKTEEEK